MSGHLPECPWVPSLDDYEPCICPELRTCEQRVLDDDVLAAAYHGQAGYAAGLDAVREALEGLASHMANWSSAETVAATNAIPDLSVEQWMWAQRGVYRAIAAIDALMVGRSGNPGTPPSAEKGETP